ncbi:hypothetical protein [Desulfitobacterium sp.]|uniref:hypothetical protein n=1 Tax=Desulfitobacterium sp. TaxID=49981 RepID=UPI002C82EE4A|nr:hypothetical protein [Desulfitobacterium sp.]HVJ49391.1 hypothetical protein [Desulfitobacterium sp.]
MYCITREDMKFGHYLIPARTSAEVVNTPQYHEVNIPGLHLRIAINLFNIHPKKHLGVPISEIEINNEFERCAYGSAKSKMIGIEIDTQGDQVYIDAGDKFYRDATLSQWNVEKIFGENTPDDLTKAPYSHLKEYRLESIIEYLEEEFAEWVNGNCEFTILTEEDIENGIGFDGAGPGDRILSDKGLEQFREKQLEYQKRLERTGFTYRFKGGLIWE